MKRLLLLFLCIALLLAPAADAAIGSKGLIVDHGVREITIGKGEKKWLFVQDGLTKLPIFKGLSFFSDNTVVATVGLHSGVLRGNSVGTAHLSVVSNKGHCALITVRVVAGKKGGGLWLLLAMFLAAVLLILIFKKHKR